MFKRVTPERAIHFTWFSVMLCFCWPPSIHSSRTKVLIFKVIQIISIVNAFLQILAFLYSIYCHLDNIFVISKSICLLIAMTQSIVQTVVCFVNYNSLQRIIEEIMICLEEANQHEREIFFKYTAKCSTFYGTSVIFIYVSATLFLLGPILLPVNFPLDIEYPFQVNYIPINVIVYLHQSFLIYYCGAHTSLGIFGALFIWFTAARFECLITEFRECLTVHAMVVCIKKQLYIRRYRYAKEVSKCFRFIVLYAIMISMIAATICGIILVTDAPLVVEIQFLTVTFSTLSAIYMYAWPADYVIDMSINVPRSIYESAWYEQTLIVQKTMLNILLYQEPVTLSVNSVMPQLSLPYYSSYLFNAFSIFTTLRAIVIDD